MVSREKAVTNLINEIERVRTDMDISQSEMAKKLCVSLSTYKNIINRDTDKIDFYVAYRFSQLANRVLSDVCGDQSEYLRSIVNYKRLCESSKRFISEVLDFELQFQDANAHSDDYISVIVPTGNLEDGMFWDSANVRKVNAGNYKKKYGSRISSGIEITSNHLHPIYNIGDILLIERKPPRDGDTLILIDTLNSIAYIRKLRQGTPSNMEPINGYGQTFSVNSENPEETKRWIKYGVVLTKMRV